MIVRTFRLYRCKPHLLPHCGQMMLGIIESALRRNALTAMTRSRVFAFIPVEAGWFPVAG
jgi:hypothetical protein